ncbi:MAG: GNAT family N-acetyltransferase [Chloroflexi bacterium]|nr:GNAT family N-acetyltransferase [Chloroflexota bacterium]
MTEEILQGKKVRLRPKDWQDVQHDYEWSRDPELSRLDATWPTTLSLAEYISGYGEELRRPSQGRYRFAIETLDGQHIGNCMFYDLSEETKQAELGILIGDRAFWNKGYGSEATCLLVDYIFKTTDVGRIYLHTLDWNIRAQKGFQKCGFVARGQRQRNGYTFMLMDVTRQEWDKHRTQTPRASSTPLANDEGEPQGE